MRCSKNALETFEVDLKEVVINNLLDGIFYARLICLKEGELIEIDSRTSDALAMAVRFNCPIYTYEFILDAAGVVLEDPENPASAKPSKPKKAPTSKASLKSYSIDELHKMLDDVLGREDYEQAAKIRDEINRRSEKS